MLGRRAALAQSLLRNGVGYRRLASTKVCLAFIPLLAFSV